MRKPTPLQEKSATTLINLIDSVNLAMYTKNNFSTIRKPEQLILSNIQKRCIQLLWSESLASAHSIGKRKTVDFTNPRIRSSANPSPTIPLFPHLVFIAFEQPELWIKGAEQPLLAKLFWETLPALCRFKKENHSRFLPQKWGDINSIDDTVEVFEKLFSAAPETASASILKIYNDVFYCYTKTDPLNTRAFTRIPAILGLLSFGASKGLYPYNSIEHTFYNSAAADAQPKNSLVKCKQWFGLFENYSLKNNLLLGSGNGKKIKQSI
jgi:hypothetical protein